MYRKLGPYPFWLKYVVQDLKPSLAPVTLGSVLPNKTIQLSQGGSSDKNLYYPPQRVEEPCKRLHSHIPIKSQSSTTTTMASAAEKQSKAAAKKAASAKSKAEQAAATAKAAIEEAKKAAAEADLATKEVAAANNDDNISPTKAADEADKAAKEVAATNAANNEKSKAARAAKEAEAVQAAQAVNAAAAATPIDKPTSGSSASRTRSPQENNGSPAKSPRLSKASDNDMELDDDTIEPKEATNSREPSPSVADHVAHFETLQ